jgi:hypothetical protein
MRWAVVHTGEMTNENNVLVVKYRRKRRLGRPRCRWKVKEIRHKDIGSEKLNWIQLPQYRI